jgi:hypothetical protein
MVGFKYVIINHMITHGRYNALYPVVLYAKGAVQK